MSYIELHTAIDIDHDRLPARACGSPLSEGGKELAECALLTSHSITVVFVISFPDLSGMIRVSLSASSSFEFQIELRTPFLDCSSISPLLFWYPRERWPKCDDRFGVYAFVDCFVSKYGMKRPRIHLIVGPQAAMTARFDSMFDSALRTLYGSSAVRVGRLKTTTKVWRR